MKLTREQAQIALDVRNELQEMGIPEVMRASEAFSICQDYDLEGAVYDIQRRSPRRRNQGVRSIDLAVYIARRTVEQSRKAGV